MRPALKAGLLPVWRDRETLQFGVDPRRAVAVGGLGQTAAVLSLLDGSRDRDGVIAAAVAYGVPAEAAGRVLAVLAAAGVLDDFPARMHASLPEQLRARLAPELATASLAYADGDGGARTLARRRAAYVRVHGASRTGVCVAKLPAASGVGHVSCAIGVAKPADLAPAGLILADLARPQDGAPARSNAAAPEVRTGHDESAPGPGGPHRADLADCAARAPRRATRWLHPPLRPTGGGVIWGVGSHRCEGRVVRAASMAWTCEDRGRSAMAEDLGPGHLHPVPAAGLRHRARRDDGHAGRGAGARVPRPAGNRPGDRGRHAGTGAAGLAVAPPHLAAAPGMPVWRGPARGARR